MSPIMFWGLPLPYIIIILPDWWWGIEAPKSDWMWDRPERSSNEGLLLGRMYSDLKNESFW